MKRLLSIAFLVSTGLLYGQNLIGAWENTEPDTTGRSVRNVLIFADGYQSAAWFDAETGAFIATNGGKWTTNGNEITETIEWHTVLPEKVGESITFTYRIENGELKPSFGGTWARIDSGEPGALAGAWLMSGRMRDGEIQERETDRPRKTMKILSGTRFQWIAYNTETKQFMGTGGGSYSTVDGKYTENIEFFSRDDSRVGASLEFDYQLIEGKWHHSGKSSKGDPLYEVWSVRE